MAHITLSGILLDPTGEFAVGDKIRFTHKSTTGSTVKSAVSWLTVPPDGSYSIDLEYGLVLVEYNDYKRGSYANLGVATVNQDNLATTIPELLNAVVPAPDAVILEMQAILADTLGQATIATEQATIATEQATLISNSALEIKTPTKADFFAQAEKRIRDNAGSGFAEWGNHRANHEVNQGMFTDVAKPNILLLGDSYYSQGVSRSVNPLVEVNGVLHSVKSANESSYDRSKVSFPPAPDGTKTYDSATGSVVEHASAAIAFAAETTTNKVITSRQDFTFLESFHEKISDKDVVYPLGNVQYGASSWEGVTLSNTVVAQGYSAFGEWDTATKGYGVVWSTLSDANKAKFLQDPENNIYNDGGELIQVRYRVRVVEGLGDEWQNSHLTSGQYLVYDGSASVTSRYANPQGSGTVSHSLGAANQLGVFTADGASWGDSTTKGNGLFKATWNYSGSAFPNAHNGLCFAVPIALVQRRNSGAYHPSFNPNGCDYMARVGAPSVADLWYAANAEEPNSTSECFALASTNGTYNGAVGGFSGRHDGKFYDAIYASDVQDLRMSSKRLPLTEIREKYKRMGIAGDVRGFESVPFTRVFSLVSGGAKYLGINTLEVGSANASNGRLEFGTDDFNFKDGDVIHIVDKTTGEIKSGYVVATNNYYYLNITTAEGNNINIVAQVDNGWVVFYEHQTHSQANPTWTDIIGSPANLAARFPQGVEGQWVPVVPDGSTITYNLNRKLIGTNITRLRSNNFGNTWINDSVPINTTTNSLSDEIWPSRRVALYHYSTQSHFTVDDVNSKVLDLGGVSAINSSDTRVGTILESSLINKIGTSSTSVDKGHEYSLIKSAIWYPTGALEKSSTLPEHAVIDLSTVSPAVKTLDYLSSENSVAKLTYAYKEMVYDVDWGDNNKFEITNNQATQTDDNGNTIKYGTASFNTQYFTVEE